MKSKVFRLSETDLNVVEGYRDYLIHHIAMGTDVEFNKLYWNYRKMSQSEILHYILVGLDIQCHLGIYPDPDNSY